HARTNIRRHSSHRATSSAGNAFNLLKSPALIAKLQPVHCPFFNLAAPNFSYKSVNALSIVGKSSALSSAINLRSLLMTTSAASLATAAASNFEMNSASDALNSLIRYAFSSNHHF
ncbi:MAG: hypothetical protein RLY80_910, partial [Actinomycetota bacterium]